MKIYEACFSSFNLNLSTKYFSSKSAANEWLERRYEQFKRTAKKEDVLPFREMTGIEVYYIEMTETGFIKFLNSLTHNEGFCLLDVQSNLTHNEPQL